MEKQSKCIVCHTRGQSQNNFLCVKCSKLASYNTLLTCRNCGGPLSGDIPLAITLLQNALGMKINKVGQIIVMDSCVACSIDDKQVQAQFELHDIATLEKPEGG